MIANSLRAVYFALVSGLLVFPPATLRASEGTDGIRTDLQADNLTVVATGEKLYQSHCASCHGVELEGQSEWRSRDAEGYLPAPPHDASGHTWHHADDLLFEITKYGPGVVIGDPQYRSRMPAYDGILSNQDIIAILSYIKHSWPEEQRDWQRQVNEPPPAAESDNRSGSTLLDKLFK